MFLKKSIKIKRIYLIIAALMIILFSLFLYESKSTKFYETSFFSMDTVVSIKADKDITEKAKSIFMQLDSIYSCHSENSEVSKLNTYDFVSSSKELYSVTEKILELNKQYSSKVDISAGSLTELWSIDSDSPHVPSQKEIKEALTHTGSEYIELKNGTIQLHNNISLDFGAVAKGAALDKLKVLFNDNNVGSGLVSTGSSVLLYGIPKEGYFNVKIREPETGGTLGEVQTNECFLSTSGGYERYFEANGKKYCHIIDTDTGRPSESDLTTVTVFCDNGLKSDFLSTLIFLEGTAGIEKHMNADDYKIVAADKNKKLYISPGLKFIKDDSSYG